MEGGSLVRKIWMAVGRAQKWNYNTFGFIILKEVSALHFGRSQHKKQNFKSCVSEYFYSNRVV